MIKELFKKNDDHNLTLIFGCPRGGTTWLWSLLESHEDVLPYVNGEKDEDGKYSTSESGIYIRNPRRAKRILIEFCKKNRDKKIIEKTPSHTLIYPKILNDFPDSKHIIILRHPLAIANSMIHSDMTAFKSYDIDKSIKEIKRYYEALEQLCTKTTHIRITYEQLLVDTELILSKVFNYFNLSDSNLKAIIEENNNTSKVLVKGAFRSGKKSSYFTELTEEQKDRLNLEFAKEIAFYDSQL